VAARTEADQSRRGGGCDLGSNLSSTGCVIVTGAHRGASTWMADWITDSPRFAGIGRHECYAFEGRLHFLKTAVLRQRIMRVARRGRIAVIKRPEILYHRILQERARSAFPGAPIIAILRNPVDRSISAWWHWRRLGVLPPEVHLTDCVSQWRRLGATTGPALVVSYSLYSSPVAWLRQSFGARAQVVFFEDAIRDPRSVVAPLLAADELETLGEPIDPRNTAESNSQRVSRHSAAAGHLAYRWQAQENHFSPRLGGSELVALGRAVSRAVTGPPRPDPLMHASYLRPEDRAAVIDAVLPDLARLEEVLGRPVPANWKQP
jgi:hypothetical protein